MPYSTPTADDADDHSVWVFSVGGSTTRICATPEAAIETADAYLEAIRRTPLDEWQRLGSARIWVRWFADNKRGMRVDTEQRVEPWSVASTGYWP